MSKIKRREAHTYTTPLLPIYQESPIKRHKLTMNVKTGYILLHPGKTPQHQKQILPQGKKLEKDILSK